MTHQEEANWPKELMQLLCDPEAGETRFISVLGLLLNEAMRLERAAVLQAQPYERTVERRGYANGYKPKTLATRLGQLELQVPQVRGDVDFYPSALERAGAPWAGRSERALKLAIAEMYVQTISTRKVTQVLEQLCGLNISSSQVSRCAALLDEELQQWRERPLGEMHYLILDARYEKVRQGGAVVSCAVLSAIGIDAQGRRSVLGVSVSLSEAEVHWREFLSRLQERGLYGVRLIVSDNHAGLKAVCAARFAGVAWQRCQFHLMQNALHLVPRQNQKSEVTQALREVFNAPDLPEAQRRLQQLVQQYEKSVPRLSQWLEENVAQGLSVFVLPAPQRRYLRTTNMLERVHKELKRRTRVATLFPNEASLLRLVSAVLAEVSQEWECGKVYLPLAKSLKLMTKLRWVWAPNGPPSTDSGSAKPRCFEHFYPGSNSVDIVGFSAYNWGYWTLPEGHHVPRWEEPSELFEPLVQRLRALAPGKSIIVAQTGTTSQFVMHSATGVTRIVSSPQKKSQWLTAAYQYFIATPEITAVMYFNLDKEKERDWSLWNSTSGTGYDAYRHVIANNQVVYATPATLSPSWP